MPDSRPLTMRRLLQAFIKVKRFTILVGHSAGGGFDTYARVISRHMGKYIPGNPIVVVNNMPGVGTIISANDTFYQAPKDGTLINSFDERHRAFAALWLVRGSVRFDQA
jgi:tripartite-type tricarboxylate transporter receptor subunit TctC